MPAARALNVALVDRVSPAPDWFGPSAKNEVTYTIFDYLIQIGRAAPGMFIPSPGWSYGAAQLQTWDVVLYFVLDRSQSLIRKKLGVEPPSGIGGGYTFFNGFGGVAASPTPEHAVLLGKSIKQLSAALFRAVPQYTKGM